jgi:RNA polymerase sigma-70 factor (ECF subfamily)
MKSLSFRKDLVGVQDELLRFAYKLTTDREEANDLLQETSLKALDNEDKYTPDTNFKGWMYTIMRNAFINNCRTKKIRGNLYVLSEPEYHFLLRDDSFIFVDNGHDAKEIREALKTLPKAHYVVFMLYRSQISGNSRKDRSVTEYDKKPYLL